MAEAKKVYRKNKKNGITYIYLDRPYWDKKTQTSRHEMKCIGKVDEKTGEDVYNECFKRLQEHTGEDFPISVSANIKLGEKLILEKAIKGTGLRTCLERAFGKEDGERILDLAFYEMCTDDPFAVAEPWLDERGCSQGLDSQHISALLARIGSEDELNKFFRFWLDRHIGNKSILFDITSISSYSRIISGVEAGYNRDKEKLKQINLALLSTYDTKMPLYFKQLSGSITDVTTLDKMVDTLRKMDVTDFSIMCDCGFYSDYNLKYMHEKHIGFTMPVPSDISWQKDLIDKYEGKLYDLKYVIRCDGEEDVPVYGRTFPDVSSPYGRVWKHLYYDAGRKERQVNEFMKKLAICKDELESGNENKDNRSFYDTYFIVKTTPKKGRQISMNAKAVKEYTESTKSCYWAIISSVEKSAETCFRQYKERNNVELHFDDIKNQMDCNRIRMHNNRTMLGKLFVCFISLILISRLREMLRAVPPKDIRYYNWKEVLSYAASYSKTKFTGKYKDLYSVPTKNQKMIFKALGIPYYWKGKLVSPDEPVEDDKQPETSPD